MRPRTAVIAGLLCLLAAQGIASFALKPLRAETVSAGEALTAVRPGEFAGTLMLGGFRGLACDLLWMRAMSAKDNRRFYESVALFQTIARVQPRFEQIWEYMSWDLAYNLAVEVDDEDGKWSWFLAGVEANVQGCRRNPGSERLLRHLAWMFHHKGDTFHQRIIDTDWAPLINPLIAELNRRIAPAAPLPDLPEGPGLSNFQMSERFYRAAMDVATAVGLHAPAFVKRMVPHGIEKDGNLWRNRGQHLKALHRYLDSLEAWSEILDWIKAPDQGDADVYDKNQSVDVVERNEGRVRRKAAELARLLAPDDEIGDMTALAIMSRHFAAAAELLGKEGWKTSHSRGGIVWLDEAAADTP